MIGYLDTAGERVALDCTLPWLTELIVEGAAGELDQSTAADSSIAVVVESGNTPFRSSGWEPLTRGAWRQGQEVVVENACTSGFDLMLRCTPGRPEFTFRWRPPARDRALARILRSRFHLLARAVLLQYPALWWAGTHGRVPLHATACATGTSTPLLSAASGIGRSTLLLAELAAGARATGDNLAVGDGTSVWGLVEPMRIEGGDGREMPHGRSEASMSDRARELTPDSLVVLCREGGEISTLASLSSAAAARALATSTYMAGELRRYWAFAATLAAGSGLGPAHPPITEVATAIATKQPCFTLALGRRPGPCLSDLLSAMEAAA
jgi:hypothetical protein